MKHMGVDYAKAISQVVYGVVLLITASLAINQLEIATGLFDVFFGIVLGSIGLAVAISFGLGTREVSSQLISGIYLREQLIPGETIKVEDNEGIINDIIEQIAQAILRGVKVTMVLDENERPYGNNNRDTLISLWPKNVEQFVYLAGL